VVVGVQTFSLSVPGASSLKAKRSVVQSLKERLRRRFNLSVAETGLQDVPGSAELTVAVVAASRSQADALLDRADAFVVAEPRVVLGPVRRELY
jgi:uncharacterized protein YlxP (DUF503 family)